MTAYTGSGKIRRSTSSEWSSSNPTLASGEFGLDTTLNRMKMGNGSSTWSTLPWLTAPPFIVPPSTGWSALNSGSVSNDGESRSTSLASSAGHNWKGEVRTLSPTSNYTARFYFDWAVPGVAIASAGIVLRNSGGVSFVTFGISAETSPAGFCLHSFKWTNPTTFSSSYTFPPIWYLTNGIPNWLQVRDDATTRFCEYSYNGTDWVTLHSVGRTDFVTPDQIGWAINANNSGGSYTAKARLRSFAVT